MKKGLTINKRLNYLIIVVAVSFIAIGVFGLISTKNSNDAIKSVFDNQVINLQHLKIVSDMYAVNIVDASHKARNGNFTYKQAVASIDTATNLIIKRWSLYTNRSLSSEELNIIDELKPLTNKADKEIQNLRTIIANEDRNALVDFTINKLYQVIDPITAKISSLIDTQLILAQDKYIEAEKVYKSDIAVSITIILIGIIFSVGMSYSTSKYVRDRISIVNEKIENLASGNSDLTQRIEVTNNDEIGEMTMNFNRLMDNLASLISEIREAAIQVGSSSTEIAASTNQLEATVTEQAASTNEVVATTKEISSTSKELTETMNEVAAMSEAASSSADFGMEILENMKATMNNMEEASRLINEKLGIINEKTANITAMVTTITKVADQTNLLSLNAAIEAEKAGEYGKGFAVVAREIRRLADQTAVATLDIKDVVKEMKSAVNEGVMSMDNFTQQVLRGVNEVGKAGSELEQIIEHVRQLKEKFLHVNEGMDTQTNSAQLISESMIQLNEGAQQTAYSLKQTNESIANLKKAALDLENQIVRFKI